MSEARVGIPVEIKEKETPPPFVISGDLQIVMQQWADRTGFTLPQAAYFDRLSCELTTFMGSVFPVVDFLSATTLTTGLQENVASTGLPTISLDRVYYQGDIHLDVTRKKTDDPVFDRDGNKKTLLIGRRDAPPLPEQIRTLRAAGLTKAALVDDVVFEGGVISKVMTFLEAQGIEIPVVCAGVVVGEGEHVIEKRGKKLLAVRKYPDVQDELCERDFYAGVPYSGRSLSDRENTGIPYFLPFGKPGEWASIPQKDQMRFSNFCIDQSIRMYSAIEKVSGRTVLSSDIERRIPGIEPNNKPFTRALYDLTNAMRSY